MFRYSILSIKINLGLEFNDDLFKLLIKFLIWSMSIFFFYELISIKLKFRWDPFCINLKDLFS